MTPRALNRIRQTCNDKTHHKYERRTKALTRQTMTGFAMNGEHKTGHPTRISHHSTLEAAPTALNLWRDYCELVLSSTRLLEAEIINPRVHFCCS
jgi:hypothetical protein